MTLAPHFFWDGRASSLEDQVLGPIANPIEMGNTHEAMIDTLSRVQGYKPYFKEAFGTEEITKDRVAQAIADYERTRSQRQLTLRSLALQSREERGVGGSQARSRSLLRHRRMRVSATPAAASATACSITSVSAGIRRRQAFKDEGRFAVTKKPEDRGAFKTPVLRDVNKHPPYMHDGSIATLREVVELYNKGGIPNPNLTRGRLKPLGLKDEDVDAIVAFLKSLDGEGYQDTPPTSFPQ